jgi:hypothetical protein
MSNLEEIMPKSDPTGKNHPQETSHRSPHVGHADRERAPGEAPGDRGESNR